jgi:hypothetical protein
VTEAFWLVWPIWAGAAGLGGAAALEVQPTIGGAAGPAS